MTRIVSASWTGRLVLAGFGILLSAPAMAGDMYGYGVDVGMVLYPLPFPAAWPTYAADAVADTTGATGTTDDTAAAVGASAGLEANKSPLLFTGSAKYVTYRDNKYRLGGAANVVYGEKFLDISAVADGGYGQVGEKYHLLVGGQAGLGRGSFSNGIHLFHVGGRLQGTALYKFNNKIAAEATAYYGMYFPLVQSKGEVNVDGGNYSMLGVEIGILKGSFKKAEEQNNNNGGKKKKKEKKSKGKDSRHHT